MTQIAVVEEITRTGMARVQVRRETACGHDCENCGGCGASGGQIVRVEAADPIGCAAGDTVVVESSTAHVLGAAALVYLLPMLTMIIGYGFGISSGNALGQIFSTLLGFALGLVPAVYLDRRTKKEQKTTFRILEKL